MQESRSFDVRHDDATCQKNIFEVRLANSRENLYAARVHLTSSAAYLTTYKVRSYMFYRDAVFASCLFLPFFSF